MSKGLSQSTVGDFAGRGHHLPALGMPVFLSFFFFFFFDQKKEEISMKHVQIAEAVLALQLPLMETLTGCQGSIWGKGNMPRCSRALVPPQKRQIQLPLCRITFIFGGGCCAASPIRIPTK